MADIVQASITYDYARTDLFADGKISEFVSGFDGHTGGTFFGPDGVLAYASDDEPRINYQWDDAAGDVGDPELLIEPDRTNNNSAPNDFDTGWTKVNGATVTNNDAVGPDGTTTAAKVDDPTTGSGFIQETFGTYTSGQTVSASVFVEIDDATGDTFEFGVLGVGGGWGGEMALQYNHQTDTLSVALDTATAATLDDYGIEKHKDGRYRIWLQWTMTSSPGVACLVRIWPNARDAAETGGIWAWGLDIGVGIYSSYCPSSRTSEGVEVVGTKFTDLWNDNDSGIIAELIPQSVANNAQIISVNDGTTSNRIGLRIAAAGNYSSLAVRGGAVQWNAGSGTPAVGTLARFGVSTAFNNTSSALDGSIYSTDTSCVVPTVSLDFLDRLEIGSGALGAGSFRLRRLTYYPRKLSDDDFETRMAKEYALDDTLIVSNKPAGSADPRIAQSPNYRASAGLWIWDEQPRITVGDLELMNADGRLDFLFERELRDKPVTISAGAGESGLTTIANIVVDSIEGTRDKRVLIRFAQLGVDLEQEVREKAYDSTAPNTTIEGQMVPITFGECTQMPCVLFDPATPTYHFHDDGQIDDLGLLSSVASNGNDAAGSEFLSVPQGFDMTVSPSGQVTASLSATTEADWEDVIKSMIDNLPWLSGERHYGRGWYPNFNASELSALSVNSRIDAPKVGRHVNEPLRRSELLREFFDPFMAWYWIDATGEMRFAQLQDPDDIAGAADFEFGPWNTQWVEVKDDLMPGLTNTYKGNRNWMPIGEDSQATGLTLQEKAEVAAEYRLTDRGSASDLHPFYRWAQDRPALGTVLQVAADLTTARDNVQAIAGTRRRFYRIRARVDDTEIVLGGLATLQWDQYLDGTINTQIVGFERRFGSRWSTITLWG